jgi:hypothetical protein
MADTISALARIRRNRGIDFLPDEPVVQLLRSMAMLRSAAEQRVAVDRLSFADAMRYLSVRLQGLAGITRLLRVPHRPGRRQLRVIRRRLKEYDLLIEPRHVRIARENPS